MQLWVAGFFKYVWPFLSPGIKGLNGETASIYSKVYIINKIGQLKRFTIISPNFFFKTFSEVRKASFFWFQFPKKNMHILNKVKHLKEKNQNETLIF